MITLWEELCPWTQKDTGVHPVVPKKSDQPDHTASPQNAGAHLRISKLFQATRTPITMETSTGTTRVSAEADSAAFTAVVSGVQQKSDHPLGNSVVTLIRISLSGLSPHWFFSH